jgi:glycosyltransferase involved in cell wall biosynthesis
MFPKISIITPSYNQAEFLERTLRSVLDQGYPNLEYFVIDGGSKDGSLEIIKKYEEMLTGWVSEPDGGQTDAILKGMSKTSGEILAYLNSDDVLLPGALHHIAASLDIQQAQWVVGQQKIIDEHDVVIARRPIYPFTISDIWHNSYLVPQECTFFTRKMYEAVGGFDSSYHYAMDMHAWLRMASLCKPIRIPEYVGCFRVHSAQKTTRMDKYFEEVDRARSELTGWRDAHGMSPEPALPVFRGVLHRVAKAAYYLLNGGPSVLREIWAFQKKYRFS